MSDGCRSLRGVGRSQSGQCAISGLLQGMHHSSRGALWWSDQIALHVCERCCASGCIGERSNNHRVWYVDVKSLYPHMMRRCEYPIRRLRRVPEPGASRWPKGSMTRRKKRACCGFECQNGAPLHFDHTCKNPTCRQVCKLFMNSLSHRSSIPRVADG